jgi:hypothetical protein
MQTTSDIRERLSSLHTSRAASEEEHCTATGAGPAAHGSAAGDDVVQGVGAPDFLELVDLILKDRPRLERVIRDPSLAADLIPRFLAVSLVGFTLFGVAIALVIHAAGVAPELAAIKTALEGTAPALIRFAPFGTPFGIGNLKIISGALRLIAAYDLGLIAAAGVCLPSLYFYGLLAGVPMSMARVTVHTVKAMATTAVALVGILPIYMAFSLGAAIFHAPRVVSESVLWLGLVLPFAAGLFGANSLYTGFTGLADVLPAERLCRRACFLRRLVVSWSFCYTAVTPVMIYTLWEYFSRTI